MMAHDSRSGADRKTTILLALTLGYLLALTLFAHFGYRPAEREYAWLCHLAGQHTPAADAELLGLAGDYFTRNSFLPDAPKVGELLVGALMRRGETAAARRAALTLAQRYPAYRERLLALAGVP
jgi:hypothetical protein